jgi:hypothetical protein
VAAAPVQELALSAPRHVGREGPSRVRMQRGPPVWRSLGAGGRGDDSV